jgi:small subunit ribosomal protein S17
MATKTSTPAPKMIEVTRVGLVESDKRTKTRKVVVPNLTTHPKYGKIIRKRTILQVHDERNESVTGDLVEVRPCRPRSRTKRWELVRIVQKGAAMKFQAVETPKADAPKPEAARQ